MSVVLETVQPVARKPHTCDICCGRIAAGDTYDRQRGVYDGEPYTHKAHLLCLAAYNEAIQLYGIRTDWDEFPDWDEDVRPLVERFFAAWVVNDGRTEPGS